MFWALYGRHWRVAGGCIALLLTWALLESQNVGFRFWFSSIAFMMSIALGITGNELRRRQLQHMGYKKIRDYVSADTVKGALHAFQIAQKARKEKRRNRRRAANSEKLTRSS
ncbi:hypothetical protein A9975_24990 [Cupriavidus sp. UME77]|nr:hypothetical protein [Cupriavidus sp. UME77]